jgi:hypothetical protein
MLYVYAGTAVTGDEGVVTVVLPDYFDALNGDARVHLTPVGRLAFVTVGGEVQDNAFTIRSDPPGVNVTWLVTGVRRDAWARVNRVATVEDKPDAERSRYRHAVEYDQPLALTLMGVSPRGDAADVPSQQPQTQQAATQDDPHAANGGVDDRYHR